MAKNGKINKITNQGRNYFGSLDEVLKKIWTSIHNTPLYIPSWPFPVIFRWQPLCKSLVYPWHIHFCICSVIKGTLPKLYKTALNLPFSKSWFYNILGSYCPLFISCNSFSDILFLDTPGTVAGRGKGWEEARELDRARKWTRGIF